MEGSCLHARAQILLLMGVFGLSMSFWLGTPGFSMIVISCLLSCGRIDFRNRSVLSNGAPGKQESFQNEGFEHIRESTNSASNGCLWAVNFVSSFGAVDSRSLSCSGCFRLFASILETARYLGCSVGWWLESRTSSRLYDNDSEALPNMRMCGVVFLFALQRVASKVPGPG